MDHHCRILLTSNAKKKNKTALNPFVLTLSAACLSVVSTCCAYLTEHTSSLAEQLRGPLQPPLLLLLLPLHDPGLHLLQHQQQEPVSGSLQRRRGELRRDVFDKQHLSADGGGR